MKKLSIALLAIVLCASCNGQAAKKSSSQDPTAVAERPTYAMAPIPGMMTDPEQRADYVARHFWDGFDFTDRSAIADTAYVEQAFVDYTQVLQNIPRELGNQSIDIFFKKASVDKETFLRLAEVAEKYLFDPNSPFRDDEYYIAVLNSVLANPALDEWERIRPEAQLEMSLKNRVGTRALDFRYTTAGGASGTLYGIRTPYTLIFINNPGCPACRLTMEQITESSYLGRLIADGTLTVLAIYPDEDLEAWRDHAPVMPTEWINSYDKPLAIKNNELYDLKAIPTLYLLDRNKTVLLKDVMSIPLIEETIDGTN